MKRIRIDWAYLLLALTIVACFLLAGCKAEERYVYVTHHDTIERYVYTLDSTDRYAFHYMVTHNDTIYVRDSVSYVRYLYKHDTMYKTQYVDSIVNNTIVKEQKIYVWRPFLLSFLLILSLLGFVFFKKCRK